MRHDCVALFAFYLGDELTLEVPDVHDDVWHELLEMVEQVNLNQTVVKLRKLFAIPRGFAKSTIAKLAVILFLHYTRFKFVLYASKTVGHGKNAIRDIIAWLSSPQAIELHGMPISLKANEGEAFWIYDIPIRNAKGEVTWKRCIFKAIGALSHIRGTLILNQRPEIIVADDIEDNDNTTPELQPKLDEWFMGAFRKAFATTHVMIFIGNMIRSTTLLARLSKDPTWNPTVYGCIVRNKLTGQIESLWESKFPLADLLAEYREFRVIGQGHTWEVEMMNLTQDEIFAADLTNAIRPPHPNPEDLEAGVIVLDPKFGESMWSDDTGITVHARIKELGVPCIIDSRHGKWIEEEIFNQMIELSWYWGINTWVIESDAAQRILIPYFKLLMDDRGLNTDAFLLLPIMTNRVAKTTRIITMRNAIGGGSYAVDDSQDTMISQFIAYKPGQKHEDLIDSASHGTTVWTVHGSEINEQGIKLELFRIATDPSGEKYAAQITGISSF